MIRPGENWVYDLFIFFVRIGWNFLMSVLMVAFYLFRVRPLGVGQPQVPPLVQSLFQEPPSLEARLKTVAAVFLVLAGGVLILLSRSIKQMHHLPSGEYTEVETYLAALLVGMLGTGWGVTGLYFRQQKASAQRAEREQQYLQAIEIVYSIRVPRQTTWDVQAAHQFVNQLLFSFPYLLLSITADHETVTWQAVDVVAYTEPTLLEQFIRAHYPEAEVEAMRREPVAIRPPFYRYLSYYRQQNRFIAPLRYVEDFKDGDPLARLAQVLSELQEGERVTYSLAVAGSAVAAYKTGLRWITQSTIHPLQFMSRRGVNDAAYKMLSGRDRVEKYDFRDQRVFQNKLREKLYYAYCFLQVDALDMPRLAQLLVLLDTQMEHFTRMPYNTLSWVERPLEACTQVIQTPEREQITHAMTLYRRLLGGDLPREQVPPVLILETREIAALWHLPHAACNASRLSWASDLRAVPEAMTRLEDGVTIGIGKYQGWEAPIRIPNHSRLNHLNVIGKTGTGKSSLLHTLIHQDIASGAGVAVLDPHGQLVRDLLRASIPSNREGDVVVLDLANERHPPPLNPLSSARGYAQTLKMVSVIERLFVGTDGAARMASYLRAALLPLGSETQATMRDVTRMFMDDVYREQRLTAIDDPETLDFWDYQYNSSSPALQRQIADPIINRIRPFYANPTLYPILCHPGALDLQAYMQQGKILLISLALDEERVPEQERNLIGALLMSQLQVAGMRARLHAPFYFYVDEVQRFVTTSLSEMLSEARKHNLALITANQYLGQLTGKTLEAVMGNVGTTVIFRCSPDDARDLAAYTRPQFDAQALMELDRFQAVVKLQVQGSTQAAFSLRTLAPLADEDDAAQQQAAVERERYLRQESSARYTPLRREEVLAWLKERYPRRRSTGTSDATKGEESTFYE